MNSTMMRPSFEEVVRALQSIEKDDARHCRVSERIEITIPGELRTRDGARIPIRLRDVSPTGIGVFHYGPIEIDEVRVKLAVHSYRVAVKWCVHCCDDLYMSGGPILSKRVSRAASSHE